MLWVFFLKTHLKYQANKHTQKLKCTLHDKEIIKKEKNRQSNINLMSDKTLNY